MSMGAALGQAMRPHWGPTDIFAPASAPAQSIFELSLGASAGREDRSDSQPPEQDVDRAARDGALPGNFKMNWTCTTARRAPRTPARGDAVWAGPSTPSADSAVPDGLCEVSSFLERFEAEQKARRKAHNDRAALHRKALAQGQRPA